MKLRFFAILTLLLPLVLCAQTTSDDATLKPLFGKGSKSSGKDKAAKDIASYLEGAVPTVDGRVEFEETFTSKLSKQEMFLAVQQWASARFAPLPRTSTTEPTEAQIRNADPSTGKIVCVGDEYMVFAQKAFRLSQARVHYLLTVTCLDQSCKVEMSRIYYEFNNSTEENVLKRTPAEDLITDKYALRSNKTKLVRENGTKYRVRTVDLKNELFESIRQIVE